MPPKSMMPPRRRWLGFALAGTSLAAMLGGCIGIVEHKPAPNPQQTAEDILTPEMRAWVNQRLAEKEAFAERLGEFVSPRAQQGLLAPRVEGLEIEMLEHKAEIQCHALREMPSVLCAAMETVQWPYSTTILKPTLHDVAPEMQAAPSMPQESSIPLPIRKNMERAKSSQQNVRPAIKKPVAKKAKQQKAAWKTGPFTTTVTPGTDCLPWSSQCFDESPLK